MAKMIYVHMKIANHEVMASGRFLAGCFVSQKLALARVSG